MRLGIFSKYIYQITYGNFSTSSNRSASFADSASATMAGGGGPISKPLSASLK